MTPEEKAERQRSIVAAHIAAENAHDWNAAGEGFAPRGSAFRDVVLLATPFKGMGGLRTFYETIGKALPDLHIEVKSEQDLPGCTVCEGVLTGTHLGEYLGIRPKGNRIRMELTTYYFFDETTEKLVAQRIYFDQGSLLRQMQASNGPSKKAKKKIKIRARRRAGTVRSGEGP